MSAGNLLARTGFVIMQPLLGIVQERCIGLRLTAHVVSGQCSGRNRICYYATITRLQVHILPTKSAIMTPLVGQRSITLVMVSRLHFLFLAEDTVGCTSRGSKLTIDRTHKLYFQGTICSQAFRNSCIAVFLLLRVAIAQSPEFA